MLASRTRLPDQVPSELEATFYSHGRVNPSKPPPQTPLGTSVPQSQAQGGHEDRDGQVRDECTFVGEPDFLFDLDRGC
jgi:hypothetical protein